MSLFAKVKMNLSFKAVRTFSMTTMLNGELISDGTLSAIILVLSKI